jgi:DMSO/TMAO reductase YedYZ molybdopterin-dependent catalytic subunit
MKNTTVITLNRREILGAAAAAAIAMRIPPRTRPWNSDPAELSVAPDYLTPLDQFGTVERGNPLPYTLPPEKLREVGLDRETWQLEVVPDPESDTKVERPLSKESGTALDWPGLMRLAEKHAVRILKVMTCNNIGEPLGVGVFEGVPLREVVWMTGPIENLRRVFYYGYHNDDPAQRFQSSLSIGRILEDPPGEHPVLLCYKQNGEFLSGKRGGPVRMLVPEAYGFKSVKWLERVVLTNNFQANDTYAAGNNDIDSPMKTFARFLNSPKKAKAAEPIEIMGIAQVGQSGLTKVQLWVQADGSEWPEADPFFTTAPWKDATILPAPETWGKDLPDGKLPLPMRWFDSATGRPEHWPMRYTLAHWSSRIELDAGKYVLRCRTIDSNGLAQPMPRPFLKSGRNAIHQVNVTIEA